MKRTIRAMLGVLVLLTFPAWGLVYLLFLVFCAGLDLVEGE